MNFWLPIFLISPLKVTKRGIKLCGDSSRDHKGSHVISTVRRSTPLPACDRVLDFHDASLSLTRGRTGWKDRAVTFSMCNGSPKCSDPFYTFLKTKLLTQLFPDSIFPRSYSRMWLIWICWWADHQTKAHKCRGHERPTSSLVPLLSQRQGGRPWIEDARKLDTPLSLSRFPLLVDHPLPLWRGVWRVPLLPSLLDLTSPTLFFLITVLQWRK